MTNIYTRSADILSRSPKSGRDARAPHNSRYQIVGVRRIPQHHQLTAGHELIDGYETVAEMETALDMPRGALVNTIDNYNSAALAGHDPEFMKHPDWVKPLDKGPYAAFDISFNRSIYLFMTLGGLKIDANAQVLNAQSQPVEGLYAAGACVAHIPTSGKSYASGMSLGPGSYFGRVAGRQLMAPE